MTAEYAASGSDALCFLIEFSPDQVLTHLRTRNVEIIEGPTKRDGARGPVTSVYCRDPVAA